MSFRVAVSTPHDEIPMPDDPSQLDVWLEACNTFVLYSMPLGARTRLKIANRNRPFATI